MHTKLSLIMIPAMILAAGCAGSGDAAMAKNKGPQITSIKVAVSALTPVVKEERTGDPDFVMLKVKVANPESVGASGKIKCLRDEQWNGRPLEHRFEVDPGNQGQYTVPVDEQDIASYTMHCRLEFTDTAGHPLQRTPSPWVKVRVPGRG